jgi:hypothetical protein
MKLVTLSVLSLVVLSRGHGYNDPDQSTNRYDNTTGSRIDTDDDDIQRYVSIYCTYLVT